MLRGMLLALLLAAAQAAATPVFPDRLCEDLPTAGADVQAWAREAAPDLAAAPVRELGSEEALALFQRAAETGWGSVETFTSDAFRGECVFYLSGDTMRGVDEKYDLDLVTVVRGTDEDGRDFAMSGILAGRGKLLLFYERGDIAYYSEREERAFELDARVEVTTPASGRMEEVRGLCARVAIIGCIDIDSLVKEGDTITTSAGPFSTTAQVTPIRARSDAVARE